MAALDDKYNIPGTYCIVDKSDQFNDEGRMTRSAGEFYSQIIISVPTRPKKVPAVTLVSFNCQCCPCIKTFPQRWKCWDKNDISLASVWWLPIATETSSTTWIWAFWVWWLFEQTQQCKMWTRDLIGVFLTSSVEYEQKHWLAGWLVGGGVNQPTIPSNCRCVQLRLFFANCSRSLISR